MIDIEYPYVKPGIAREVMGRYEPDNLTKFQLAVAQGFGDSWFMEGLKWLDYENQVETDINPVIEKENWNEDHIAYREGLSHKEGITESQAQLRAEEYDRDQFYAGWFKNVGAWDGYRIGGYLVGSMPDPINFIPLGKGVSFLVTAGNFAYKSIKARKFGNLIAEPARIAGILSKEGLEASVYTGLAASVIYGKKNVFEQKYGISDIGMDMAFGFGAGFAIGNFARAGRIFKNLSGPEKHGLIIEQTTKLSGKDPDKKDIPPDDGYVDISETESHGIEVETAELKEMTKQANLESKLFDKSLPDQPDSMVQDFTNSVLKDKTFILYKDSFLDVIDKLGDKGLDFIDVVSNCLTGAGKRN